MNIDKIITEIKAGNLVITPTDTVYGILADAMNLEAVEKVYIAKQRSKSKPLLLLVSDIEMLREYTSMLSEQEAHLINTYMPGKLTLLLKKNTKVLDNITNGGELVGVRIPDNADLREIIRRVGNPLVSTSANLSDKATATNPELLEPELLEHISYIENIGTIESEPSSLIRVAGDEVEVLRMGEVVRKILAQK